MHEELFQLIAGRRGHFEMESGYHSEWWFELGRMFDAPARVHPFVSELARRLAPRGCDVVCGPATGGAQLARLLGGELGVPAFYSERAVGARPTGLFPVDYRIPVAQREALRGKTVALVDDAVSAGSAVRGTHADLLACGARPVALGALIVFGDAADKFAADRGLSLDTVARLPFSLWRPAECPLCAAGRVLEKISDRLPDEAARR